MINQRTNQGQTIIKLLNYDIYNSPQTTGKPSNKPKANQGQTTDKPEANQNKEYKESKELKESKKKETVAANAATLERRKKFGQELVPFIEKYSTTMIRAFYDYWSETNKSGVKMRFELQQTWELPRRLATWAKRDLEFTNRTNKKNNESEDYETKITG
jgi:hypothetical protein